MEQRERGFTRLALKKSSPSSQTGCQHGSDIFAGFSETRDACFGYEHHGIRVLNRVVWGGRIGRFSGLMSRGSKIQKQQCLNYEKLPGTRHRQTRAHSLCGIHVLRIYSPVSLISVIVRPSKVHGRAIAARLSHTSMCTLVCDVCV